MKKVSKIVAFLFMIIAIANIFFAGHKSKAENIGDIKYLERAEQGFYSIQRWNGSQWIYVTYSITNYIDENGIKRVAYCIDPNLKGIGYIPGEFEGYNVELKTLISDEKCWRVIVNGYPYKTPEQLNVENEQDAYLATKMALYAMLRGNTEEDIRTLYRAGKDRVAGQTLADISRRGNKVIEAICRLVNIGNNGTETMQYNNILSMEKVGNFEEETSNKDYYSQKIKVCSTVECSEYFVNNISNFPNGTKITNEKGIEQLSFKGGEVFKVMVPKASLTENITGSISISGTCKNYPIFYSESLYVDYQDYLLCCDEYSKNISPTSEININIDMSKIIIHKVDKDTKEAIGNVKFSVKYKDGTNIGTYTTDKNGVITIDNLHQGQIVIKEIETEDNYELNTDELVVKLSYNETKNITIENVIKKSQINIVKVDADDNKIRIEGAKFEVYNQLNELIETVITDKNGEAKLENLPVNCKYTVREIETAKDYILSNDVVTVELKENEVKTLTFKNKKKTPVKNNEKLPRTGTVNINNYLLLVSVVGLTVKRFL